MLRAGSQSCLLFIVYLAESLPAVCRQAPRRSFQKFVSGDGIAGRKPYGFCTRMVHCLGWKLLEAHCLFTLDDVDKSNFNAVLRRSLDWRVKACVEDPQVLESASADLRRMVSFSRIRTCRLS